MIASGAIHPLAAVFTDAVERSAEYSASASYRGFIVDEVLPAVESGYAVAREPGTHGVIGSSRGGLAALDLALVRPDLYDLRWLENARSVRDALERRGDPLTYREISEGHTFVAWRARLPEVLRAFDASPPAAGGTGS